MDNWGYFTLLIGVITYNPIYNWIRDPPCKDLEKPTNLQGLQFFLSSRLGFQKPGEEVICTPKNLPNMIFSEAIWKTRAQKSQQQKSRNGSLPSGFL